MLEDAMSLNKIEERLFFYCFLTIFNVFLENFDILNNLFKKKRKKRERVVKLLRKIR